MKNTKAAIAITVFLVVFSLVSSQLALQHVEAQASPAITLGTPTIGTSMYRFSSNKDASAIELTESGTMLSISVYFSSSRFFAKTAIYTDAHGRPSALIVQSRSEQISSVGWHTFILPQNSMSPGNYWFAVICSSWGALGRATSGGQANQHCVRQTSYSREFKSTFGVPSRVDNLSVSIYGTFAPATASGQLEYGIYWDKDCFNETSSVNWGALESGTTKSLTVYVRNEGTVPFILSKSLLNWDPSNATVDFTLTWDYTNQTLLPADIANLTLTLGVSPSAQTQGPFSFDTEISAIES